MERRYNKSLGITILLAFLRTWGWSFILRFYQARYYHTYTFFVLTFVFSIIFPFPFSLVPRNLPYMANLRRVQTLQKDINYFTISIDFNSATSPFFGGITAEEAILLLIPGMLMLSSYDPIRLIVVVLSSILNLNRVFVIFWLQFILYS